MDVDEKSQPKRPPVTSGGSYLSGGAPSDVERVELDIYDTEAQESLLEERLKTQPGKEREAFESFLEVFPTSGAVWNRYVQHELHQRQYDHVDKLFKRCLVSSVSVELWMTYLKYVVDATMASSKSGPMERKTKIRECFEYALGHIGMDMGANVVWEEYIAWLKREGYDPNSVCEVYFRALSNPMHKLDAIWRDFEKFTEKLTRANTNEVSAKYSTAKRVYEERLRQTEGLTKNVLARPPRNQTADLHQAKLWKQLIEYEKTNPQDLDEDKLAARVAFTFNQALVSLYHYPEIWHQASQYQLSIGQVDAAKRLYAMALGVLPNCLLIHFQFCDFLELHNLSNEADLVYKNLLSQFTTNELVWTQYMYFARRVYGIQAGRKVFFKARKQPTATYHIYVAAAQLEYYVNKDPHVARNVYELGYHLFERQPHFLKHYVNFLYHQSGEDSHMRVLFEKILANLPANQALELWNQFLQFETVCGNLEPASKLQVRRSLAFPGMDPSGVLASVQRYRFLDLWPCTTSELASFDNDFTLSAMENDEEHDVTVANGNANGNNSTIATTTTTTTTTATESNEKIITMPDVKQMQLYKGTGAPGQVATSSTLSIRLDELITKLPSARDWAGPMVNIELLMQSIQNFIDTPVVVGPSRYVATRADEEEESGLQARARDSAMANDSFRKRVVRGQAGGAR
jgi:cleavage stimulation factor subunit 3